jgi:hypothetical protein
MDFRFEPKRLVLLVGCSLVFGLGLFILWATGVSVDTLLADPTAAAGVAPLTGMFALLGVMGWVAAAAACAVTGLALRARGEDRRARFMLGTAAFLTLLALDDAFQFHESLGPEIGIPERASYVVLAGAAAAWLWSFRHNILQSELGLFAAAIGGVGIGVGLDVVGHVPIQAEDPFKLVGIVAFVAWAFGESLEALAEGAHEVDNKASIIAANDPPLAEAAPALDGEPHSTLPGLLIGGELLDQPSLQGREPTRLSSAGRASDDA